MGKCRLCLQEKELIKKSHIIPDFMYRHSNMYNENHQIHTFTLDDLIKGKGPQMIYTGEYEGNLLCSDCDNRIIGELENYGKNVIFGGNDKNNDPCCEGFQDQENRKFWICRNVNYRKYKLFMLSILWRMGISSRPLFKDIQLGEHEEALRSMILNSNPREFYCYPIFSSTFLKDKSAPKDMIVQPVQFKGSIEKVLLILPGMLHAFVLSTDDKTFPLDELKNTVINEDDRLFIYEMDEGATMSYIKNLSGLKLPF